MDRSGPLCFTPITPALSPSDSYFSPRPTTPAKRLRSCLSPTRTPTGDRTPSRPASRATSFGSEYSMPGGEAWRRSKSVRWEGENEGCAVTSYQFTWSAAEYDRTPLEPPSEAERTCVLPERGSRSFTSSYDCFDDQPYPSSTPDLEEEDNIPSSPGEEISQDSLVICTPANSDHVFPQGEDKAHDDEDRQWEECMERRRMMFAMRSRTEEGERQPEFEGYRSISAKLVEMLRSIEARRLPSPAETDEEEEEEDSHDVSSILSPAEEEEEEDEPEFRAFSFTFTNLQSLHIKSPKGPALTLVPIDDSVADTETTDLEMDMEATTPSLISCSESSESDHQLVSPRPSLFPISSRLAKSTNDQTEADGRVMA